MTHSMVRRSMTSRSVLSTCAVGAGHSERSSGPIGPSSQRMVARSRTLRSSRTFAERQEVHGIAVNEAACARHPYKPEIFATRAAVLDDGTIVDW